MDKYTVVPAITVCVIKDNQILLLRRKDTGYMDGYYAVPGGHLEPSESLKDGAARELKEETGIVAKTEDIHLFQILQEPSQSPPYMSFRFYVKNWEGEYALREPDKSDDIAFFNFNNLPKVSPYVRFDLEALGKNEIILRYVEAEELETLI